MSSYGKSPKSQFLRTSSMDIIPDITNDSNTKKQHSLFDNQGRELTKEQQEYFKDSKARDENGNLLRLYHGTAAEFTEFRTDYRGAIWLSSDKDVASRFDASGKGKTKELYADITNPLEKEFMLYDNWDIDEVIRVERYGKTGV